MKIKTRNNIKGLVVVLPMMIYFAIFTLVPFVMLFYFSFTDLGISYGKQQWIGFKNYIDIFKYTEYINSLISTIIISVSVVAVGMVVGFILAVMLNSIPKGKTLFRTIWYIPALISMAVISKVTTLLLAPTGAFNKIIQMFGGSSISWYDEEFWMYFWIIFIVSWKGFGSTALLFIAGLNGISKDVYEAADIDGASRTKQIFSITLPLLRPMTGFILITGFIGAFNIFEPVLLISNGGPESATKVILFRIYDEAFKNFKQGFASALSVIVLFLVMILTFVNMKMTDGSILKMDKK